jgi:hypothetical protein
MLNARVYVRIPIPIMSSVRNPPHIAQTNVSFSPGLSTLRNRISLLYILSIPLNRV